MLRLLVWGNTDTYSEHLHVKEANLRFPALFEHTPNCNTIATRKEE